MNWLLIIDDKNCKKDLSELLKKHKESVLVKIDAQKVFESIENSIRPSTDKKDSGLLVVSSSSNLQIIRIEDIMHCQSYENYTQLFVSDGRKITSTKSLKEFEIILKKDLFIRVHQSHLVNLKYVDKYVRGDGGHLILTTGTQIPVAARKKESLLRKLEKL